MEPSEEYTQSNIKRESLLGTGTFGEVFIGIVKSTGKKIALKRVSKQKMETFNFEYMKKAILQN